MWKILLLKSIREGYFSHYVQAPILILLLIEYCPYSKNYGLRRVCIYQDRIHICSLEFLVQYHHRLERCRYHLKGFLQKNIHLLYKQLPYIF